MTTNIAENAAHDVCAVLRHAQYVIEIDSQGGVVCRHNPHGPLNVIAVIGEVYEALIDGPLPAQGVLLEVGLGRAAPYQRSRRFIRHRGLLPASAGFDVEARSKYFALSKGQYLLVVPHLLRLMQEIADTRVRSRRSGNMEDPFVVSSGMLRVRRGAHEVAHWPRWERRVRGICFDIDARDQYLVADLCKATLGSAWLAHEVFGLHGFLTRCLNGYSPNTSYERLLRCKYSSAAVEALRRSSLADYAVLELLKRMKKHPLFDFLAYVTECYLEPTPVHLCAQKALPKIRDRLLVPALTEDGVQIVAQINTRVICLNGRLNVEIIPSEAAKRRVLTDPLYDPCQIDIDEIMFELNEIGYDFDDEPPF